MTKLRQVAALIRTNGINPDPRVERAARWLSDLGYSVFILAWDRMKDSQAIELNGTICIRRFRFRGGFGAGIGNVPGLLAFNLWCMTQLIRLKPEVIYACDFDTAIFSKMTSSLVSSSIFLYDIFDVYADSHKLGALREVVRQWESHIAASADLLILPHEERVKQLTLSTTSSNMIPVYNSPEENELVLDPSISLPFSSYFSYVGILHGARGIIETIEAAKRDKKFNFMIAGFGPLSGQVNELANDGNVCFLGRIPYDQTLMLQKNSAGIIAQYDPKLACNKFAAPNKLFEAMMLGKPVITSEGTLMGDIVSQNGIGIVIEYGDILAIGQACEYLMSEPDRAQAMGLKARQLYDNRYSPSFVKKIFNERIRRINRHQQA